MKKLIIALSPILFILTGCESSIEPTRMNKIGDGDGYIEVLCLEEVEYYFYRSFHEAGLTPVIDKHTLTFKTCEK